MFDLAHIVGLFAEVSRTKLKVAQFRPLAAVLDKPVVRKLHAAGHEFYWSPEAQLGERKHEGWELVIECEAAGRSTIFMDRKEKLVLLHRRGVCLDIPVVELIGPWPERMSHAGQGFMS